MTLPARALVSLACASLLTATPVSRASTPASRASAPASRVNTPASARKVLAPTAFPGWQTHNVCFPFVVRDPARSLWRMYYTGSATEQISDSAWDLWMTGVVTSTDLTRWRYPDDYEPVLVGKRFLQGELVDLAGSEPPFDAMVAAVTSALRDGAQWRAWYTGWNGDERPLGGGRVEPVHFRIGHATSPDGLRWTKRPGAAERGSVIGLGGPKAVDALAAAHPSVLKVGTAYRAWYEAYDGRNWRIAHAESPDGIAWTKRGVALEPGADDALDALGARHPLVRKTPSGYELWYQGRSRSAPAFHVLRARSPDGSTWVKEAGEVALHPDPPVQGDERLHVGSVVPRPDGSLLVFFAKETKATRAGVWGTFVRHTTAIYSESVRP